MTTDQDKRVCLGVITGATGVKGEVKIKPYTEVPQDVGAYGPVDLVPEKRVSETEDAKPGDVTSGVEIQVVRAAKEAVVARLSGIEDRDAAEALRGLELYVSRAELAREEEDEYYHADLIGLAAQDLGGATL